MPHFDKDPIIIADAGPLIRLAAAGLLDSMRLTNRRIVLVDRIEEEVCGDVGKPFAADISDWIARMGDTIERAETVEGAGIRMLRIEALTAAAQQKLKRQIRNSGERAIREYIEAFRPADAGSALVVYEDGAVPGLMAAARVPMTLMSTRAFVKLIAERGYNADAVRALEAVSKSYSLKPSISTIMEGDTAENEEFLAD